MPRTARRKSETNIYHIMLRGINRQNIFIDDEDNLRLLYTLDRFHQEVGYELYAYCLMGNHIHLLIKEGNEELSNTMKRIGASFVYWYNWQYNRKGHLFQDRFKSEPVENDAYFLAVLRYIHQNPLKAGLVSDIETYRWSSYREYIDKAELVNVDFALKMFASSKDEAIEKFRDFNLAPSTDSCLEIPDERKTMSDKELRSLALEQFGIDIALLHREKREVQTQVLRFLKELGPASLRQISRLTGLTVHKIYRA